MRHNVADGFGGHAMRSFSRSGLMRAAVVLLAMTLGLTAVAFAAPLDRFWPMSHHDVRRTNHSPASGAIATPVTIWRYFLGGAPVQPLAHDVDLDGAQDVLSLEGGRAVARTISGKVLWETAPLGATRFAGVADLTGDGTPEVVVISSIAAYALSAQTGKVLWTSPAGLFSQLAYAAVADFDGDGTSDLALADNGGAGLSASPATHVYRFVGAVTETAKTTLPMPGVDVAGAGGQMTMDIDGDGLADFLVPGVEHLFGFSGKTGALLAKSDALPHMTYAYTSGVSRPAKDGGAPWLVFSADYATNDAKHSLRGVYVLRRVDTALVVQWSMAEADVAGHVRLLPGAVGDLDGDGLEEVILARLAQGVWTVEARDLATGTVLATLDAGATWLSASAGQTPQLLGLLRLGASGPAALQVSLQAGADTARFAPLRLVRFSRKAGFALMADLGVGELSAASVLPASEADQAAKEPLRPALPLTAGAQPGTELAVLSDLNGDLHADQMALLRIALPDPAGAAVSPVLLATLPMTGDGHLALTLAAPGGTRRLLLALADGHAPVLDAGLKLLNDLNGDGQADLTYGAPANPQISVAPVHDKDALPRVTVSVGDTVTALDLSTAGPMTAPSVAWTARPGGAVAASPADVDGDGAREILVRHRPLGGSATLSALSPAGKTLWSYVQPEGPFTWLGDITFATADVDSDGCEDAIAMWTSPTGFAANTPYTNIISGKTGKALWPLHAPCSALFESSLSLDDTVKPPRLLSSEYHDRFACDSLTGEIIQDVKGKQASYGVSMLADLNGDGLLDTVIGEGGAGIEAEQAPDLTTLWFAPDEHLFYQAAALVPVEKVWHVASLTEVSSVVTVRNATSGKILWQKAFVDGASWPPEAAPAGSHTAAGLVSVADLTGKGHPSLLFRTSQGMLYAVDATSGAVDWVLDWGGTFGDPIPADLDGDGLLEILVSFSDGYLYAIDQGTLGQPAWVRENAGTPALTDAEDIDVQEDASAVHANWAAVPGASGYSVRILDDTGAAVTGALDVGPATSATVPDLYLQTGVHYLTSVAAYISSGPQAGWSPATLSDGFAVVDQSPPLITAWTAQPAALLPGTSSTLSAHLVDKTRLASWSLQVQAPDGKIVGAKSATVAQAAIDIAWTWTAADAAGKPLPAGDYTATLVVLDGAGHVATATTILYLCGPGEQPDGAVCKLSSSDGTTPKPKVKVVQGSHPEDCCSAAPGSVPGAFGSLSSLCGIVALVCLAKRRRKPA